MQKYSQTNQYRSRRTIKLCDPFVLGKDLLFPLLKMVFNFRTYSSSSESVEDDPTPPRSFSLEEIRVATRKFSRKNILGEYLYRGCLADGSLVAVKRAPYVDQRRREQLETELQVGSTVSRHPNVLCLRGFCRTEKELFLVYPLMINNSLFYHLRKRPDRLARPLDWTTRKQIALGAARGLAHLHNQGNIKIVHRNICASNILLNVHFEAVIRDFSSAVIMHEGNIQKGTIKWSACSRRAKELSDKGDTLHPLAFRSYCYEDVYVNDSYYCEFASTAPEVEYTGKCTLKCDVFAYGRMLLQLITGQSILELDRFPNYYCLRLGELVEPYMNENKLSRVIDPNLQGSYVEEEAEQLLRLAMLCSYEDPSIRPEMSEVVLKLESQFLQRDTSTRSSRSQSECDSTPYYSLLPSPSHLVIAP